MYLVDVSDSVPDAALDDARAEVQKALDAQPQGRSRAPRDVRQAPARRPPGRRGRDAHGGRARSRAADRAPRAGPRRRRPTSRARCSSRTASIPRGTCGAPSSSPTACRPTATSSPRRTARKHYGVKLFAIPYKRPVPGEVAVRELRASRTRSTRARPSRSTPRSSRAVPQTVKLVAQAGRRHQRPRRRAGGRPHSRATTTSRSRASARRRRGHLLARASATSPRTASRRTTRYRRRGAVLGKPVVLYVDGNPARASVPRERARPRSSSTSTRPTRCRRASARPSATTSSS